MVRETRVHPEDLIYPIFIVTGEGIERPISSLPRQRHFSPDRAAAFAAAFQSSGGRALLLFGIPDHKDDLGLSGSEPEGPVQLALKAIKDRVPELLVMTDVCLCEYTTHGHCGVLKDGKVLNDPTLELLAGQALSHAEAGADLVAP